MSDMKLKNISAYFLMREILYDGKAGLDENIEPISIEELQEQLVSKFCINFGDDKGRLVDWFVNSYPNATAIEKDSIAVTFRLLEAENKFLSRTKPKPST